MTTVTQLPGQMTLPLVPDLSTRHCAELAGLVEAGWQFRAACAGMAGDLFVGPDDDVDAGDELVRVEAAKDVCAFCPVARSCLAAALLGNEDGVWGRTTATERDVIRVAVDQGADVAELVDRHVLGPIVEWRQSA